MHADDEVLLDAAADVISACCGLLACGGKVHNLAVHCLNHRQCTLADRIVSSETAAGSLPVSVVHVVYLLSSLTWQSLVYAHCRGLGSQAGLGQVLHPSGAYQCFHAQGS